MKDIHDVIEHAKFGDDRLRGSGVVAGQISAFPIDYVGRPYNTLTLPCERVIGMGGERIFCPSRGSAHMLSDIHSHKRYCYRVLAIPPTTAQRAGVMRHDARTFVCVCVCGGGVILLIY